MRRIKAAASAVIPGMEFSGQAVGQESELSRATPVAAALQFTSHRADEIGSALNRDSSRGSFASRLAAPSRVVSQVRWGELALNTDADEENGLCAPGRHGGIIRLTLMWACAKQRSHAGEDSLSCLHMSARTLHADAWKAGLHQMVGKEYADRNNAMDPCRIQILNSVSPSSPGLLARRPT